MQDQIDILDVSKSYGPDEIPPRLITEGGRTVTCLLTRLFNLSLSSKTIPKIWKKANVVPIYKKDKKTIVSNYRPISLISVLSKLFEKVIFKYVFNHLHDNFVISTFQSGFLPGKSTVTQLAEVYHHFCNAIDRNKEIRVVFLDISKAFDRVWHTGLLYKLHKSGISNGLLLWFKNYLSDRQQRVVISGEFSSWQDIKAGVPQGSVLGPLLFLLYINDISNAVTHCQIRLFADDTCLFLEVDNREETALKINEDLKGLFNWSNTWLVTFSELKTKSLIISNKKDSHKNPLISMNNIQIEEVSYFTYLGLTFTKNLRWNNHIDKISVKARKRLCAMMPLKFKLNRKSLEIMYKSFVMPVLEYGLIVWGGTYDSDIAKIERIQIDALRLITGATARSNISFLYKETSFISIRERIDQLSLTMMYKIKNDLAPEYLRLLLPEENNETIRYNLRNNRDLKVPFSRLETLKRSFFPRTVRLWNALTSNTREKLSLFAFKTALLENVDTCNILYYYGERWASVHHARIRIGCSKLNADLCLKLHVENSPACSCGYPIENGEHFFLSCPNYDQQRNNILANIRNIAPITYDLLLHGCKRLSNDDNIAVFSSVHLYIKETRRFD